MVLLIAIQLYKNWCSSFTFQSVAPSAAPVSPSGQAIGTTTIMLTWSPPPAEDQNGIIRNYVINITELETGMAFHYTSSSTSILVYSLHPFYRYVVTIAAVTVGQGPATIAFTVQTWEDGMFAKYARPLIGQGTTNFNRLFFNYI